MHLIYENDIGKISFSGSGKETWRIKEITGLELPGKNFNVVSYAGQDGQETISEMAAPRVITISGDVCSMDMLQHELSRAVRILNKPGRLKLYLGNRQRKIDCRVNAFELVPRSGVYQPFVLQLIADKPFFEDFKNLSVGVFSRMDMVGNDNILPMALTGRSSEVNINNLGHVKTEPIFYVYNISGGTGEASENGFEILNHTTGQHIRLNYSTIDNEIITIDLPGRKITSNKNGNLIQYISNDTFLSDFWLSVGANTIEAINNNPNEDINVVCEFTNQYIEAVY